MHGTGSRILHGTSSLHGNGVHVYISLSSVEGEFRSRLYSFITLALLHAIPLLGRQNAGPSSTAQAPPNQCMILYLQNNSFSLRCSYLSLFLSLRPPNLSLFLPRSRITPDRVFMLLGRFLKARSSGDDGLVHVHV